MTTALEIADWLVELCADQLGAPIDSMSLEKQLYYAQSFHLALGRGQLFSDDFQAWKWGPVVREVWSHYSGAGPISHTRRTFGFIPVKTAALSDATASFVRESFSIFSTLSQYQLSEATHREDPWLVTRGDLPKNEKSDRVIAKGTMASYYATLMAEGEDALSRHALLATLPDPRWGWFYVAGIYARRMAIHPMYVKALSVWGASTKLWEVPAEDEYTADLYPRPPKARRELANPIEADSPEQLREEIRRLSN